MFICFGRGFICQLVISRMSSSLVGLNCFLVGACDALSPVGLLVPVREIHIKQFLSHLKECNLENRIIFLLNSSKGSTINIAETLKIFFSCLWEMEITTKFEKNMYITYRCRALYLPCSGTEDVALWPVMVVTVPTGKGGRMVTLLAETVKNMCNFV